jgi:hypothetical protein
MILTDSDYLTRVVRNTVQSLLQRQVNKQELPFLVRYLQQHGIQQFRAFLLGSRSEGTSEQFVASLDQVLFLGNPLNSSDRERVRQVVDDAGPTAAALEALRTRQALAMLVNGWVRQYRVRADAGVIENWIEELVKGLPETQVQAAILAW